MGRKIVEVGLVASSLLMAACGANQANTTSEVGRQEGNYGGTMYIQGSQGEGAACTSPALSVDGSVIIPRIEGDQSVADILPGQDHTASSPTGTDIVCYTYQADPSSPTTTDKRRGIATTKASEEANTNGHPAWVVQIP